MKFYRLKKSFFCSWSGGKDSCLALYKTILTGGKPKFLLTMCIEEGERSRSHGVSLEVLKAQSDSLGIPLVTIASSWQNYHDGFINGMHALKKQDDSIAFGVFGDMDIEANCQWERDICAEVGLDAYLPLWNGEREKVLCEFLGMEFKAMIIAVDSKKLGLDYLGRIIDFELIEEFKRKGIDSCGENGEYHSCVFDGPIFKYPLLLEKKEVVLRSGYYFLDIGIFYQNSISQNISRVCK